MPNQEQYPYEIIEMTNKHAIPCLIASEGLVSGFLQFIIRPHFAYFFSYFIDWTICNLAKSSCSKVMAFFLQHICVRTYIILSCGFSTVLTTQRNQRHFLLQLTTNVAWDFYMISHTIKALNSQIHNLLD